MLTVLYCAVLCSTVLKTAEHIKEAAESIWAKKNTIAKPEVNYIVRLPETNAARMTGSGILGNRRRTLHLMVVIPHSDIYICI